MQPQSFLTILIVFCILGILSSTNQVLNRAERGSKSTLQKCYQYQAKRALDGGRYRERVELFIQKNGQVEGTHELTSPHQKKGATLAGNLDQGNLHAVLTVPYAQALWDTDDSGEQFEMKYRVSHDQLLVGYQETLLPRYHDEQGVLRYDESSPIIFDNKNFVLRAVDCS